MNASGLPVERSEQLDLAGIGIPALQPASGFLRVAFCHQFDQQAECQDDAYYTSLRVGLIVASSVWDTLIYRDPFSGEYKGQLAEDWKQIDDKTLEFNLRKGIQFHNGEPFNADSVVFTLNYVSDPANKATKQQDVRWIDRAEKVDEHTVRIISKEPFPAAKEFLATTICIYPAEYYKKVGPQGMSAKPVGTGPYKVAEYVTGKSIRFERNKDYFKASPRPHATIDTIMLRFIPDGQTQVAELMAGQQDLVTLIPKDQFEQLKTVPTLQAKGGNTMRIIFLQINCLPDTPVPALKDVRVRQAMALAINRPDIVKNVVGSSAEVIDAICAPTQFGCTREGLEIYDYNPDKARELLAQAGYAKGFDVRIVSSGTPTTDQVQAIISNLRAVGIRANLTTLQYPAMRQMVLSHKAELVVQNWGSNMVNDASASTPIFFGAQGDDLANDAKVHKWLDQAGSIIDGDERKALYQKALAEIAANAYAVPLWTYPVYYAAKKDLDFKTYPDELIRFWDIHWK